MSDPTGIRSRADFGHALTAARERAGLTVRQVASKTGAHRAHSTIGDWFAGRGLPSLASQDLFVAVLDACGIAGTAEQEAWLAAWHRVRKAGARRDGPAPYRGLATYQPEDTDWFFGRERLVARLYERVTTLRAGGGGLLVVVGASGAGKSSLLRAGLVAALRAEQVPVTLTTPGAPAVEALPGLVKRGDVLVVDQFEEVFTADLAETERKALVAALVAPRSGTTTVLGLRADFYGHALRYPQMLAAVQSHQCTVGGMDEKELRAAIVEPARLAGVEIEPELVDLLVREVMPTATVLPNPGVLPLLSHALYATWQHDRRRMTSAGYLAVGGIYGAIGETAAHIYRDLSSAQQRLARRLFLRLVHVGQDTADTRRRVPAVDLRADFAAEAADLGHVVERFIAARLLTADAETIQISHEALLAAWPTLRAWLDTDRATLVVGQHLAQAATGWRREDDDPSALYRGTRLTAAQAWAADHPAEVSPVVSDFLAASTRHDRQRLRRARQLTSALAVLSVITLILTVFGFDQWAVASARRRQAVDQRNQAVSRLVAGRADKLRGRDVSLAMQLSLAAYRLAPTVEARSSLLDAYAAPAATRLAGFHDAVQSVAIGPDRSFFAAAGVEGTVRLWQYQQGVAVPRPVDALPAGGQAIFGLAVSPDGRTLAAGGADRTVHLWHIDDLRHPVAFGAGLGGPAATIYSLAFSSDGHTLAAGSADGDVWRWDLTGGVRRLPTLTTGKGAIQSVAFSPDRRLLAAGDADTTVRLWDTGDPEHSVPLGRPLRGHTSKVYSVAFAPDGRTLASGSGDGTVRLWNLGHPERPALRRPPLTAATSWVNAVCFSPDGGTLAVGTSDKEVVLWNVADGRKSLTLPQPTPVTTVAFGVSGRSLITGSTDSMVRVWALPGPVLTGNTDSVFNVAFGDRGRILLAASRDRTVSAWNIADRRRPRPLGPPLRSPAGHPGFAGTVATSADGRLMAAGTRTGEVQLWRLNSARAPTPAGTVAAGTDLVEAIAFNAQGTLLAAGGDDARVRLYDIHDPGRPRSLATIGSGDALILSLAFQPGHPILAVAKSDDTVQLWDVSDSSSPRPSGAPLGQLSGYAYSVAFGPDGRTLAVGSADRTVRLWDVRNPARAVPLGDALTGPSSYVYAVAFSPDGHTVAAASTDGTVWLWDVTRVANPAVIATLGRLSDAAYTVAFSPDGRTLAAAGSTTLLWDPDPDRVAAWVCGTAGASVTPAEWREYVPGAAFAPPC